MRRIGTKIDFMMTLRNGERLRQFPRPGTKLPHVLHFAPLSHDAKTALRLNRPNENEPIPRPAFDEDIQHPVHAVVEIDVGRAWFVPLDEGARARTLESMTSFVALDQIRFRLNDKTRASFPNELGADQIFRALERINLKKTLS